MTESCLPAYPLRINATAPAKHHRWGVQVIAKWINLRAYIKTTTSVCYTVFASIAIIIRCAFKVLITSAGQVDIHTRRTDPHHIETGASSATTAQGYDAVADEWCDSTYASGWGDWFRGRRRPSGGGRA